MIKVFMTLAFLLILVGCQSTSVYDSYTPLFEWTDLQTIGFDEGTTLVYFYNRDSLGTECAGCQLVRDPLFNWVEKYPDFTLYLINDRVISGLRPAGIRTAPTLIFVDQGVVTYYVVGAGPILALLDEMDQGTFDFEKIVTP